MATCERSQAKNNILHEFWHKVFVMKSNMKFPCNCVPVECDCAMTWELFVSVTFGSWNIKQEEKGLHSASFFQNMCLYNTAWMWLVATLSKLLNMECMQDK